MGNSMDFTTPPVAPLEFTIDGDTFYAAGECPGGTVTDLALSADSENETDQLQVAMAFFDQVLLPESADLFAERLRDPQKPISLQKAMRVFAWLVGKYTDFPTQEQSPSPSGSTGTAKSSAARSSTNRATTRSPKAPRSAAV
jgi:hypothetical protein